MSFIKRNISSFVLQLGYRGNEVKKHTANQCLGEVCGTLKLHLTAREAFADLAEFRLENVSLEKLR